MNQTSESCEFYLRLFRKLVEILVEADARTPPHISSKPYISRAKLLAEAGMDYASRCIQKL